MASDLGADGTQTLRPTDMAEKFTDEKSVAACLDQAMAPGNSTLFVRRLREVANARELPELVIGMTDAPDFKTAFKVISGLNLRPSGNTNGEAR